VSGCRQLALAAEGPGRRPRAPSSVHSAGAAMEAGAASVQFSTSASTVESASLGGEDDDEPLPNPVPAGCPEEGERERARGEREPRESAEAHGTQQETVRAEGHVRVLEEQQQAASQGGYAAGSTDPHTDPHAAPSAPPSPHRPEEDALEGERSQLARHVSSDDSLVDAMPYCIQTDFRLSLKFQDREAGNNAALQQQVDAMIKKLSAGTIPAARASAPGRISHAKFQKLSSSPYTQRSDSMVKQPRFRITGNTLPPRTLPLVPGPGTGLLMRSGIVTPRPTAATAIEMYEAVSGRGSSVFSAGLMGQNSDKMIVRRQNVRPASAPSSPSTPAAGTSPGGPVKPPRPATSRSVCGARTCPHSAPSHRRVRPPASAETVKSGISTKTDQSRHGPMQDNPYEIVSWAMTDRANNSISHTRWPYVSTWASGEPRYEGYCTPLLPANNRYGINGPCCKDEKVVPPRCGMEFLEQLHASSLQIETPKKHAPEISPSDQGLETAHTSVQYHLQQADEIDEKVWASERRGRALLAAVAEERFGLAQVDAVEELARDNDTFYKALHRSDRMLYWAERKSREKIEANRKAAADATEFLEVRYQRVIGRWSSIVYQKSHQLALRIKQATAGVHSKRNKATTLIQSLVRGWLGRIRVQKIRKGIYTRLIWGACKAQALYRGWKDRRICKLLRELRTTSSAARRLFAAQKAFQRFDVDGDGFISADEFVDTLKEDGVFLDGLSIEAILACLPIKSDYRRAIAAAEKQRLYNNDLFLNGRGSEWCEAPPPGQNQPLSFSDFCVLIDLDVSESAIFKMQEAIKVFAKFDADGSGAIDGDEVVDAIEEMEKFTGVPVNEEKVRVALKMGHGELDFEMFVSVFGLDTGSSDTKMDDQVDRAFKAFQQIDSVGAGEIGPQELSAGLKLMGVDVELDEVQRMFEEVDEDGSGVIDFFEFCHVSGIHHISERLKRKYMPGYLGEVEEEEDEEEEEEMHKPKGQVHAAAAKKATDIDPSAYEDGESLVGHPHSRCIPVVGLRVRPSRNCRSGTLQGVGTIMEIMHMRGVKRRVRVQHDDGFERYYDCGNNHRFELVVVPKVHINDEQLSIYYKAQPHLIASLKADSAKSKANNSRGVRRFDHLSRSLFELQNSAHGKDESARNKIRSQQEQINAQIQEITHKKARAKWTRVQQVVKSPSSSPLALVCALSPARVATGLQAFANASARTPAPTAQDAPAKVPLALAMAAASESPRQQSEPSTIQRTGSAETAALVKTLSRRVERTNSGNVPPVFKRTSSRGPAGPQAVVSRKGRDAGPPAVGAQGKAKASGGSEGTVMMTRSTGSEGTISRTQSTSSNGGTVTRARVEETIDDPTWESRMKQRDAKLRAERMSQGSFRGSFKLSPTSKASPRGDSATMDVSPLALQPKDRSARILARQSSLRDALRHEQDNLGANAQDATLQPLTHASPVPSRESASPQGTRISPTAGPKKARISPVAGPAVATACQEDSSESMEGSERFSKPTRPPSQRQIFGMGASFKRRQSFRNNFADKAQMLSHHTEALSSGQPPQDE